MNSETYVHTDPVLVPIFEVYVLFDYSMLNRAHMMLRHNHMVNRGTSSPRGAVVSLGLRMASPLFRPAFRGFAPVRADGKDGRVGLVQSVDEETENLGGEYCSLDQSGKKLKKRTVGEMEQVILFDCW